MLKERISMLTHEALLAEALKAGMPPGYWSSSFEALTYCAEEELEMVMANE